MQRQIFVKSSQGEIYTLNVVLNENYASIKNKIVDLLVKKGSFKSGEISTKDILLLHAGKKLKDNELFTNEGKPKTSQVSIVLRKHPSQRSSDEKYSLFNIVIFILTLGYGLGLGYLI